MSEDETARYSRLCPEHRRDRVPSGACAACAQARRIAELEQVAERLSARVEKLEQNDENKKIKTRGDVKTCFK